MRWMRLAPFALLLAMSGSCATPEGTASDVRFRTGIVQGNEVLKVGDPAPPVEAVDEDGRKVPPSRFSGKPLLVDFGSVFCMDCRNTVAYLERARARFEPMGLTVLMIAIDGARAVGPVREFMARSGADLQVVYDDAGRSSALYGVDMIPSQYLIDRDGIIRAMHAGFGETMFPDELIRSVLSNQRSADGAIPR